MDKKSHIYLCILLLLASLTLFTESQQINTHQNITTNLPKLFKLSVAKGDQVRISVFDTNAQYQILFQMDSQQLAVSEESMCFRTQICSLEFKSLWDADGVVILQVLAYEYSYEIIHNGITVKREDNVVTNFIGGKFVYSKYLEPNDYTLKVSYESQFVPQITMTMLDINFTIKANQINQVLIQIDEIMPFYFFYFTFTSQGFEEIAQHLFPVTIQIPNQMLKGCDGTNLYDPKIRACPIPNIKVQDTFKINKLGSYPTFQLKQQQKVQIKITILQFKRWKDFFDNQFLTVYIAESHNPKQFYGLNKFEIATKIKIKKECLMSDISCIFQFSLFKGNYTVMPLFPRSQQNAFVYLYERFNGNQKVESFYSVLPTLLETDKKFYQVGAMLEFNNHKQKLTQISITCDEPFLLMQYMIFKNGGVPNPMDGSLMLDMAEFSSGSTFNKDLNKVQIFTELQPNKSYLIFVELISEKKIADAQKSQKQQGQDLIDFVMQDDVGASYESPQKIQDTPEFFYLEAASIELKIINGKFPHRKLLEQQKEPQSKEISQVKQQQLKQKPQQDVKKDQNTVTQVSENLQSQTSQNNMTKQTVQQGSSSTSVLLQVLGALVIILVLLILVYLFFLNTTPQEKNHNELVTEQPTGSITLPDNSIQISQIIKTESSMSSNRQTQLGELPQSTQKQQQKQ